LGLGKAGTALWNGAKAVASGLGTAAVATARFVGARVLTPLATYAAEAGMAALGAISAPVAIGAGIMVGWLLLFVLNLVHFLTNLCTKKLQFLHLSKKSTLSYAKLMLKN
jgi:hypothetical protein